MINISEAVKDLKNCPNYGGGICKMAGQGEVNLPPCFGNQCCLECEKFGGECTEVCDTIEDRLGISKLLEKLDELYEEEDPAYPSFEFINIGNGNCIVAKDYAPLNADDATTAVFFYRDAVVIYWSAPVEMIKDEFKSNDRPLNLSDFDNNSGDFNPKTEDIILSNNGDYGDCVGMLTVADLQFLEKAWNIIREWYKDINQYTIYIAGPDVFFPDAVKRGELMKKICRDNGFNPLYPLDNEYDSPDKKQLSKDIFYGNISSIMKSDIIVANLMSFRGAEPDSGTVFELGVGYGLGKILYGYIPEDTVLAEKVRKYYGAQKIKGSWYDKDGLLVEDFDQPLNLMISESTRIVIGSFKTCIEQVIKDIQNGTLKSKSAGAIKDAHPPQVC